MRSWASQRFVPTFVTFTQSSPCSTAACPSAGSVNEVVQGRLLPSLNVSLTTRLCPDSAGGFIPGEPFTGGAFHPDIEASPPPVVAVRPPAAGGPACCGDAHASGAAPARISRYLSQRKPSLDVMMVRTKSRVAPTTQAPGCL